MSETQTLCVDGVVMVCLTGQQAVCTLRDGVLEEASACAADDGQPPHCFAGVGELDLHRRAVERLIAAGGKLFLRLFASSGTVMGSMLPTRPQPSANASISRIPKIPASTSLTPPSAASRFVCIQIAEMPLFTSWKATSCPLSF